MSEYSMPSYFQSMPVIGKDLSAFHEDNAAEIQAVEQEIHEIREAALEAGNRGAQRVRPVDGDAAHHGAR